MRRRPPRSTRFPYTTLFRSWYSVIHTPPKRQPAVFAEVARVVLADAGFGVRARVLREPEPPMERSEEHTSELQSRQYLVCRLLLEKKHLRHVLGVEPLPSLC